MFAGGVTSGMQDTGYTVSRLPGEGNPSVNGVKGHSEIDQVSDAVRGFIYQDTYCFFIAQTTSGSYGIVEVQFR